jgi:hypothetical protein
MTITRRKFLKGAAVLCAATALPMNLAGAAANPTRVVTGPPPTPEAMLDWASRARFSSSWYNGTSTNLAQQIGRALRRGAARHYVSAYVAEHGRLPTGTHDVNVTYGDSGVDLHVSWTKGIYSLSERMTFPAAPEVAEERDPTKAESRNPRLE